jgi:hypothetical protein
MPNYYTTITADSRLEATPDEHEALEAALYSGEYIGFGVDYYDGEVLVFAEYGDWEALPNAFLALLGTLIAKNGLEYLEFGPAAVDDEPWMGICDAAPSCFRIRSNGSIWEPTLTW